MALLKSRNMQLVS